MFQVYAVMLYLLCLMTLHINSSSLLQLQTFEGTTVGPVSSALPSLDVSQETLAAFDWEAISNLTPYVTQLNNVSQIYLGLANGTLYEVLSPNVGVGQATVRAVTFQVDCGLLPNALFDIQVSGSTSTLFTDKLRARGGFATISMLTGRVIVCVHDATWIILCRSKQDFFATRPQHSNIRNEGNGERKTS